jgi:hypothetical protein
MLALPQNAGTMLSLMSEKRLKLDRQITSKTPAAVIEYLDFSVVTIDICAAVFAAHSNAIFQYLERSGERTQKRTQAMKRAATDLEEATAAMGSGRNLSDAEMRAIKLQLDTAQLQLLGFQVAEQNEELFETYANSVTAKHYSALEQILRVDDPELLKRIAQTIAELSVPWVVPAAVGVAASVVWGPVGGVAAGGVTKFAVDGTKAAIEVVNGLRQLKEAVKGPDPEDARPASEFFEEREAFDAAALNWCVGTHLQTEALVPSRPDERPRTIEEAQAEASKAVLAQHTSRLRSRLRI